MERRSTGRDLSDRWRAGKVSRAEVEATVGAWIAHAENADTWRRRQAVFGCGWFEPLGEIMWSAASHMRVAWIGSVSA
jgi:hypothetical protein